MDASQTLDIETKDECHEAIHMHNVTNFLASGLEIFTKINFF